MKEYILKIGCWIAHSGSVTEWLTAIGTTGAVCLSLNLAMKNKRDATVDLQLYKKWREVNGEKVDIENQLKIDVINTGEKVLYVKDLVIVDMRDFPKLRMGKFKGKSLGNKDSKYFSVLTNLENPITTEDNIIPPGGSTTYKIDKKALKCFKGFSLVDEAIAILIIGTGEIFCSDKEEIKEIYYS